ncbi:probable ATP-dependent RNA helicase spindle-E [Drosophila kikkawai]|uniref:Probable ATP-dependent RNA helicase spindle-E n=1 Tax=Drosophila kikkawai TaxID=30033 RepID=A0ABM4GHZ5_DROKI
MDKGDLFELQAGEDIKIRMDEDQNLPIYAKREEIMAAINANPVVILTGETGCGKTTQVPQYILDESFRTGEYCKIAVTQPRRIAAISIANRVCEERQWQPGTVTQYTHIVLDEVHERDQDMDFLLIVQPPQTTNKFLRRTLAIFEP